MTFSDFSKHLSKIEATPKRLEITDLLAELIKKSSPDEIEAVINLSLGQLAPLFRDIDFGLAEKMMIKAIAKSVDEEAAKVKVKFKRIGDLGGTVEKLKMSRRAGSSIKSGENGKWKTTKINEKISVDYVFSRLNQIAFQTGEGSQERKINQTADLLRLLDPLSAKYAVRIILGNLRLGFSDKTVLDALSMMVAGDKSAREKLEAVYNVRPDIGWMTRQVKSEKLKVKSLIGVNPELGTPILPALCQRLEGTEEIIEKMCRPSGRASSIEESGGNVAAEPKWDGQRIQAHINLKGKPQIQLFTRGLENVASMFPDLVETFFHLIQYSVFRIQNCILDGEVVGFDLKTNKVLPFQTMITRKRKYGISEQLLNVPIRYMVFDIMYLNGKSLMQTPFSERRKILERMLVLNTRKTRRTRKSDNQKIRVSESLTVRLSDTPTFRPSEYSEFSEIIQLAPQLITSDPSQIRKFLQLQISSGLEGIVAKRLDSPYSPGRTGFSWVKLKWEGKAKSGGLVDTVDCIVMGTYAGQGKRAGFGVGAFLVGILNTEYRIQNSVFLTISKIGTGLTDEQWRELKVQSSKLKVKSCPKEYNVPKALTPDVWVEPKIVVEIQADNLTVSPLHTAGFALRFPRLVRYRTDKKAYQITTTKEVKRLYKMQ